MRVFKYARLVLIILAFGASLENILFWKDAAIRPAIRNEIKVNGVISTEFERGMRALKEEQRNSEIYYVLFSTILFVFCFVRPNNDRKNKDELPNQNDAKGNKNNQHT